MSKLFVAFALSSLSSPALAHRPVIFEATNADKASGFRSMAECETALGRPAARRGKAVVARSTSRGSAFNRQAGNVSRCEMIAGEPQIVVYPTGRAASASR